ncbi:MAG: four helix bundle protein [Flexistipes sinusarabici]|uniref:Four helix bundle protein n=1 Tax=Flexistipes sinusarabici TaxID=2352 RepID=A0A5D0MTB7_FLESI|nr:four helix bundle protein [Flexistipes sinusarabici]TYB35360.1 MAG: four helix bundle protein [Flexistipes sinusarabici]
MEVVGGIVLGRSWNDLIVWQKAHNLVLEIFEIVKTFPNEEKYCIVSQIKRSVYSVPANIVEGHSKNSNKDFIKYLYIARGSAEELKYFLLLSRDLEYLENSVYEDLLSKLNEISYLLNRLIKSLTSNTLSTSNTSNTFTN